MLIPFKILHQKAEPCAQADGNGHDAISEEIGLCHATEVVRPDDAVLIDQCACRDADADEIGPPEREQRSHSKEAQDA